MDKKDLRSPLLNNRKKLGLNLAQKVFSEDGGSGDEEPKDEVVFDYSLNTPPGITDSMAINAQNGNGASQKTNFNHEFAKFKKTTEMSIPFTMTQFEDVLYVREDTLLTLQYIFYQKDHRTTLLK